MASAPGQRFVPSALINLGSQSSRPPLRDRDQEHPLELCFKHTPENQQDDVALLRTVEGHPISEQGLGNVSLFWQSRRR